LHALDRRHRDRGAVGGRAKEPTDFTGCPSSAGDQLSVAAMPVRSGASSDRTLRRGHGLTPACTVRELRSEKAPALPSASHRSPRMLKYGIDELQVFFKTTPGLRNSYDFTDAKQQILFARCRLCPYVPDIPPPLIDLLQRGMCPCAATSSPTSVRHRCSSANICEKWQSRYGSSQTTECGTPERLSSLHMPSAAIDGSAEPPPLMTPAWIHHRRTILHWFETPDSRPSTYFIA